MKERLRGLLNKSEKYTGTDMIYLTKGSFWLSIGHMVSTGGVFILAIIFANFLPKEIYGTYKFILSIFGVLVVFSLNGITTSLSQAVSRGFEGSLKEGVKTRIRWGIVGGILGLCISVYYYINKNIELSAAFALVSIFVPFIESFSTYESYLQGKKVFKNQIIYNIISRLFSMVSLICAVVFTNNLFLILLAYIIPWTITRLFFYLLTLKKFPPNNHIDKSTISYGKHMSFIGVVNRLGGYLDNILLFHYLGSVQVAVYSFALAPIDQIKAVYKNIPTLAVPKLSNRSIESIDKQIYKRMFKLFILGIIIGLSYVLIAPYLFKFIFPQYIDSVLFSQLLAFVLVIRLPMAFMGSAVQSKLNITPKSWLYWRSSSNLIFIIALLIFTPIFGIIGVILSRLIYQLSAFTVQMIQWKMFVAGRHLK